MADYEALESYTSIRGYFARPYYSRERGSNENFNGLIRQFFPGQACFTAVLQKQVDLAANLLKLEHENDMAT